MKKIILTLLLTLSALVNVNAVAAFSLDIDGNGTINASNDGLIIFKYLLNSNANNLHTTISSNAADDRKTTAQLKAYLDNSGDILDVDGNGTTNASNDGLIVFKYLLNSNANNLHTTIASNAPGSKTTTINLKAYLDQYTNTDVSNMYSGDRPTELTAEQIADANGAGTEQEHLAVLQTAGFSNYRISFDYEAIQVWVLDTDLSIGTIYARIQLPSDLQQLRTSLDDAEFQAIFLETIQAIWDLVNPITERQSRLNQLDALETKYNILSSSLTESGEFQTTNKFVTYLYQLTQGTDETYQFGEFDYIEDVTDWDTKLQELEDQVNPPTTATYQTDLAAIFANDTAPTELTPLLTAEANRVANTTSSQDKKNLFENLTGDGVTVTYGFDSTDEFFTVSSNGNSISNNVIANFIVTVNPDEADLRSVFFNVILEKWNQLYPAPLTAAEELVAIFALGTSPTAFVDYPALDAEADGILQAARAQHIVNSLTNLNGVTVTYTINTTPKSFNVAKAGETTINVLQDSSSGSAVSLDTLSVFKDIYFQTIQAKWDILHPAVTERQSRLNQLDALGTKYEVLSSNLLESGNEPEGTSKYVVYSYQLIHGTTESYQFGAFDFIQDVTDWDTKLQALEDQIKREDRLNDFAGLVGQYGVTSMSANDADSNGELFAAYIQDGGSVTGFSFGIYANFGVIPQSIFDTKFDELVAKLIADEVTGPTVESEAEDFYASTEPPTGFVANSLIDAEAQSFRDDQSSSRSVFLERLSSSTYRLSSASAVDGYVTYDIITFTSNTAIETISADVSGALTKQEFSDFTFKLMLAVWHLEHPNYVAPTPFEIELAALYASNTAPTGFVSGGAIETEALAFQSPLGSVIETFMQKLNSENYEVFSLGAVIPVKVTLKTGQSIDSPYDDITVGNHTGAQIRDWALEVVKAIYLLENPPLSLEEEIAAMYDAATPPTSFVDTIGDAAILANQNATVPPLQQSRIDFISLFDKYGLVFTGFDGFTAEYANNSDFPSVALPGGNNLTDTSFKAWALAIAEAIWHYGHPNYVDYAALRAERIAEIKVLDDASVNVTIANFIHPTDGDTFEISIADDTFLLPQFSTTDYESGVLGFAYLGDNEWDTMKSDISDKITEIDDDISLRNDRRAVLIQNSNDDVTVGTRYDGTPLGDADPGRGDLFEIFNASLTEYAYVNDFDLDATGDYTRLEDLTDAEYNSLNDAIIAKVEELDPANTVANYGFIPADYANAPATAKRDYLVNWGNTNRVLAITSFVAGGGANINPFVQFKYGQYPKQFEESVSNGASYADWKIFVDRVKYLLAAGDDSDELKAARETEVAGLSSGIVDIELGSPGNNDWDIQFNGLNFIYGGFTPTDIGNAFANVYNESKIEKLSGAGFEALLVEIVRIRTLVLEADALERNTDQRKNHWTNVDNAIWFGNTSVEWVLIGTNDPFYSNTNYGNQDGAQCVGYATLSAMDNYNWRYLYIIAKNELLKQAGTTYYNHLPQNECTP